jgi:hypothetical protein
VSKRLDIRAFLVFQRLYRFFITLNVVAALVAGLSLAILTFNEFHPTQSNLARAAEGLLCSSAITAVISVMTSTMLLFRFEGQEVATRRDLALAWSPLVMLDVSILEYLFGILLWYTGKNNSWRTALMTSQLAALLLFSIGVAVWMWQTMSDKGGLGKEEIQAVASGRRAADS